MSLNASKIKQTKSDKFKPADPLEAGTYPARLVQVILTGIQSGGSYKGEVKPDKLELRVTYEILDEFMKDEEGNDILDKPRWISENFPFFSLKADLATSTKRYFALDPDNKTGGDWATLVGTPCMVTVVQSPSKKPGDDRIYNNVASVSSMRPKEAAKAEPLKNPTLVFDFYEPDLDVFLSLPDWLQDRCKGAVDFVGSPLEALLGAGATKGAETKKATVAASEEVEEEADW